MTSTSGPSQGRLISEGYREPEQLCILSFGAGQDSSALLMKLLFDDESIKSSGHTPFGKAAPFIGSGVGRRHSGIENSMLPVVSYNKVVIVS